MDNFKKLIQLAKADGGKFFVLDENGEPSLVIMGIDEYEKILVKRLQNQVEDIEEINRKIIEIQKGGEENKAKIEDSDLRSEVIDPTFSFERFSESEELEEI